MKGIDNKINLGVGNISTDSILGPYYQDISPAIIHIKKGIFAKLDESNIPYLPKGNNKRNYPPVLIIQYALMNIDLYHATNDHAYLLDVKTCLNYLDLKLETFYDSLVWRSEAQEVYNISDGWISGMYQGQGISLYLRAFQIFNEKKYLETAKKIFKSFDYNYEQGGFKRYDENNCIWFEEFPSSKPSFVLNGFIYAILGIFDYYRVTKDEKAKNLWDECVITLEKNLHKYDTWYWSIYDQLKKELVSYYYMKNVHIPLMKIMYALTGKSIFDFYARKWEKNLNNPLNVLITNIMYRIKHRI